MIEKDLPPQAIKLADLSEGDLQKIVNSWHRILLVFGCWLLGGVFILALCFIAILSKELPSEFGSIIWIGLPFFILCLICIYGVFKRKNWGKDLGFVLCAVMLLGIPLGTIVGVLGMLGFSGSKLLFGENAIEYSEIKRTLKELKFNATIH